ncbi:MAG: hypothetical protein IPM97_04580 [Bdellovibrionaceae bacterium]|nr:hypothetical protein [Pseudobdellovibrionaceae bacterium]
MKVQLVSQDQNPEDVLEGLRQESTDLSELDYQAPSDSDIGSMDIDLKTNESGTSPQRQKMSFSRQPVDDSKLNLAERRKQKKR